MADGDESLGRGGLPLGSALLRPLMHAWALPNTVAGLLLAATMPGAELLRLLASAIAPEGEDWQPPGVTAGGPTALTFTGGWVGAAARPDGLVLGDVCFLPAPPADPATPGVVLGAAEAAPASAGAPAEAAAPSYEARRAEQDGLLGAFAHLGLPTLGAWELGRAAEGQYCFLERAAREVEAAPLAQPLIIPPPEGTFVLAGTVQDAVTGQPVVGASIHLYRVVAVLEKPLPLYDPDQHFWHSQRLPAGDYAVLELGVDTLSGETLVRVYAPSVLLDDCWIRVRGDAKAQTFLVDQLERRDVAATGAEGFSIEVNRRCVYGVRAVLGEYYDGEGRGRIEQPIAVTMQPAPGAIREEHITELLSYFQGYRYSRFDPRYPYQIPGPTSLPAEGPRARQNNCVTFTQGLLVKAWERGRPSEFTWDLNSYLKWVCGWNGIVPPLTNSEKLRVSVATLVEHGMADEITDVQELPPPWTFVQGWTVKGAPDGGHNYLIVDSEPQTRRVLTLESTNVSSPASLTPRWHDPDSTLWNGPSCRTLGHLDAFATQRWKCPAPCGYVYDPVGGDPDHGVSHTTFFEFVPSTWSCPRCGTPKSAFLRCYQPPLDWWRPYVITWDRMRANHQEHHMARLRVYDLRWVK